MGSEKFHNRYRIASERAPWHAYDDGAYFVTICTAHHEHYFGKICNGEMHHSVIGQFVADNLRNITAHYLYAEIPVFVVMPNHLHAIVCIDGNKIPYSRRVVAQSFDDGTVSCHDAACRDAARHVSTNDGDNTNEGDNTNDGDNTDNNNKWGNTIMHEIANKSGWLSVCIGGVKSAITRYAHQNNIVFEWQTRFYDHIICDTNEMDCIANYIENNVARWETDDDHNNISYPF